MRVYDPRAGRFLSVDPLMKGYPMLTPYQYASNRPVDGRDQDGLEWAPPLSANGSVDTKATLEIVHANAQMGEGLIESGKETLKGIWNIIRHPINTINGLVNVAAHPVKTINAIRDETVKDINTDPAKASGKMMGNFLQLTFGGNFLKESKIAKDASAASDALLVGSEEMAASENFSLKSVNKVGGTTNCVNCSIATDSYLKGAPASALSSAPKPLSVLEKEFGTTFTHGLSIDEVKSLVGKEGEMGIVFGNRGSGQVGHVFNVINQKGKINFIDGQTGKAANLSGYENFSFLPTKK